MGGPTTSDGGCGSSSGEEDGDAGWKAAINSVATTSSLIPSFTDASLKISRNAEESASEGKGGGQQPKHYQIKAQKLLDDILEKSLEIVQCRDTFHTAEDDSGGGGIQLFKRAPSGIMFDQADTPQGPKKRPRILPGKDINENSKKFKEQLLGAAVDGLAIIAAAKEAGGKSLARMEYKEATAKAAAKKEEERVAELKRLRGEKWLPSIAKEMKLQSHRR